MEFGGFTRKVIKIAVCAVLLIVMIKGLRDNKGLILDNVATIVNGTASNQDKEILT